MSICQKFEEILARLEKDDVNKEDALRRAEEMANKYHDVKPKTDIASPEQQYRGLSDFSK